MVATFLSVSNRYSKAGRKTKTSIFTLNKKMPVESVAEAQRLPDRSVETEEKSLVDKTKRLGDAELSEHISGEHVAEAN